MVHSKKSYMMVAQSPLIREDMEDLSIAESGSIDVTRNSDFSDDSLRGFQRRIKYAKRKGYPANGSLTTTYSYGNETLAREEVLTLVLDG